MDKIVIEIIQTINRDRTKANTHRKNFISG
jgi:hypothetical protein